jgi:4'-phosphopantetheinyl transferase
MTGAVHLSLGCVSELAQEAQQQGLGWLGTAEQSRLARISASSRQLQFIAGRWLARRVLAAVHGSEPGAWVLSAPDTGPPTVRGPASGPVYLSISHSSDKVGCAVAASPVGVDLEVPRKMRDVLALAEAVCSPDERERLHAAEPARREAVFHECWTLKEAWLKSRGEDMSPGRLAQIDTVPAFAGAQARVWRGDGLTLALVVQPALALEWIGASLSSPSWWAIRDAVSGNL